DGVGPDVSMHGTPAVRGLHQSAAQRGHAGDCRTTAARRRWRRERGGAAARRGTGPGGLRPAGLDREPIMTVRAEAITARGPFPHRRENHSPRVWVWHERPGLTEHGTRIALRVSEVTARVRRSGR